MKQNTLNPITKEWEMMTTLEWRRLKAGFSKHQDVPEYDLDFRIDLKFAIDKWAACKEFPAVKTYIIEVMIKTGTFEPQAQAELCLWFYHSFHYPELEKSQSKVQQVRTTIHEIKRLAKEIRSESKGRKRSNRR